MRTIIQLPMGTLVSPEDYNLLAERIEAGRSAVRNTEGSAITAPLVAVRLSWREDGVEFEGDGRIDPDAVVAMWERIGEDER